MVDDAASGPGVNLPLRIGRTHLMDAVPITLGQVGTSSYCPTRHKTRVAPLLHELNGIP